jgi:hypothetical protein
LDEKTKEIVERLRGPKAIWDGDLQIAASLIESLSERVGELESALTRIANHHADVEPYDDDTDCWDHIANLVLTAKRALSKQGEG